MGFISLRVFTQALKQITHETKGEKNINTDQKYILNKKESTHTKIHLDCSGNWM